MAGTLRWSANLKHASSLETSAKTETMTGDHKRDGVPRRVKSRQPWRPGGRQPGTRARGPGSRVPGNPGLASVLLLHIPGRFADWPSDFSPARNSSTEWGRRQKAGPRAKGPRAWPGPARQTLRTLSGHDGDAY